MGLPRGSEISTFFGLSLFAHKCFAFIACHKTKFYEHLASCGPKAPQSEKKVI